MKIKVELTNEQIKILVNLLEEKLESIPVIESAERFDYGYLQSLLSESSKNIF